MIFTKNYFTQEILSLFLFIFSITTTYSQTSENISQLIKFTDEQYGTDNFLVNGWKYLPDYFNASGDPYFNNLDWTDGIVVSSGKTFNGLDIRYNLQMDVLVLKYTLSSGMPAFILLNSEFVDSFILKDHKFVNLSHFINMDGIEGYAELILSGDFLFITKYQKTFVGNYSDGNPFGSFSKQTKTHFIVQNNVVSRIASKKALYKYFSEYKKPIKAFMKGKKIRFSKASDAEIKMLIEYCHSLATK